MTIWQQDFARRKPLFWLAAHFRCVDDRLSDAEDNTLTGGHRAATMLRSPGRRYSARRRQPHGEGANTTVQKPRHETKKAESYVLSMVCRAGRLQRIEIVDFPERHFWHEGYDKAQSLRIRQKCRRACFRHEMVEAIVGHGRHHRSAA